MNAQAMKFSIAMIGPTLVGKDAIATWFVKDTFDGICVNSYVDEFPKTFEINGILVNLLTYVFTGIPGLNKIMESLIQYFDGIIFVFDMSNYESLEETFEIYKKVLNIFSEKKEIKSLPCVLAANKSDLVTEEASRKIILNRGKEIANIMKCKMIETSPKIPLNINELFLEITERLISAKHEQKKRCFIC